VHLLSTPLVLLSPLPLKIAVDSAIGSEPLPGFLRVVLPAAWEKPGTAMILLAVGMVVLVALLTQLQALVASWLHAYAAERMTLGFRSRLFRRIQRLSLAYHDRKASTDTVYHVQYDAASIQYIVIDGLIPFITAAATTISMLYVTFRIDRQLALVALAVAPVFLLLWPIYRRRLRNQAHQVKDLESDVMSVVQEVVSGIRVVKAFGQESREEERFVRRSREGMGARIGLAISGASLGLLVGVTTAVGMAAALFIGIRNVQAGSLTVGSLLLVMGYLSRFYDPLRTISKRFASLQSHLAGAERVFALLDREPAVRSGTRPLQTAVGDIAFRHVHFGYDAQEPVLHDVSFEARAGTRVGIAGSTGAGKSTLVSLLMRFYDHCSGQILLDGVDIREYRLADLRDQFAIVLQDPILFSTTIRENIAYARPEATPDEIVAAARAANAHPFISELPEGYDTCVGERGIRLSGGERQRVSLARAFLKNAPILILDEPTSSVDVGTESSIMEAMNRLMSGRTTFMIAHRLGTLARCDVLLQIEAGRVVATRSDVSAAIRDAAELPLREAGS